MAGQNHTEVEEPARCLAWARAVTAGAVRVQLRPTEVLLVAILQRETFLCGRVACPVELGAWSRELGLEYRKLRPHWEELVKLGVVDLDAARGVCQLRPDSTTWGNYRGLRTTGLRDYGTSGQELPLKAERELAEARNQVSREAVLGERIADSKSKIADGRSQDCGTGRKEFVSTPAGGVRPGGTRDYIAELRAAVEMGSVVAVEAATDGAAEFSAALAGNTTTVPPAENSAGATLTRKAAETRAGARAAENSAGPIAKLASDRTEAKLAKGTAEKSAGEHETTGLRDYGTTDPESERAWRWVQEIAAGRLHQGGRLADDWQRLCAREPGWVLGYLRGRLEKSEASGVVRDRLGYIAVVSRKEGKFRR